MRSRRSVLDRLGPDVLAEHVWERIQARLEQRLGRIERLVMLLYERQLTGEEVAEALTLCNAVSTSLGTLGITAGADLIRVAAGILDQDDIDANAALNLSSVLDDARLAVVSSVGDVIANPASGRQLLVVGPQLVETDHLIWAAIMQNYQVSFHENGLRPVAPDDPKPEIVVVVAPDPDLAVARPLLRAVAQSFNTVPTVVLCPRNTLQQKLRGVEFAATIMELESSPSEVLAELTTVAARRAHGHSIISIGRAADWLAAKMVEHGLSVRPEPSVSAMWRTIQRGEAEALLIVQDAFTMSARELLALMRADPVARDLPTVVVGPSSLDEIPHLYAAGADAVFSGDRIAEAAAMLQSRLRRSSILDEASGRSQSRGALPWKPALVLVERMMTGAMRRSSPVGLALIALPFDRSGERDEQLARDFRRGDIVARYDDGHIVVMLEAVNRRTMVRRMQSLSEKFGLRALKCRIACMEFPVDGRSVDDLITVGQRVLERATAESGPHVVGADWRPHGERPPDVYILDPDVTLGSVLKATMERRGLRVVHETDSLDGLRYLTGGTDRPLPRLVLLELEQRGVGGLQFLRQMQASGTLGQVKLIVVSSRTLEAEMRQAFELGVDDYVAKPFSTPLLLHRVNRALET